MSENEEFIQEFLEECEENLDQLDQDLVALEQNPHDSERLQRIFRTIHTIKGTSGFFGFSQLGALAHDGESLLGRLRDGELILNQDIASALLQLMDGIRRILAGVRESGREGLVDYREISANLIRLALSSRGEAAIEAADEQTDEETDEKTDKETVWEIDEKTAKHPRDMEVNRDAPTAIASEASIRVDVRLLDDLLDLAGELVLVRNQLNQFSASIDDASLVNTMQRLSSITSEIQEGVMRTRLQPISTLWGKFPRVIRDLAVACGKEVALEREGDDTELDRSLLEAIKDPLTHLIRNAVDHGVEPPESRESLGKSRQGRVLLRAYHEGGQVHIEIIDDGAGIDVDRVKQQALQRGVIGAEQAAAMSDQELVQMIFRPGFSTAEQVTNVSGRGVGMDVVKTNIESIGGTINLQNRPGRGTTVHITIPLTLAIIPALIVSSDGQRFAIPQLSLVELLNYRDQEASERIEWVHDVPVCRLRGSLLPLVHLNQIFELEHEPATSGITTKIVVLQAEGRRFGLVVDQVIDTEEIVVKPLSQVLKSILVFAGATIMGDGAVALILDVVGLALKAGVAIRQIEPAYTEDNVDQTKHSPLPYLLCESDDRQRVAIHLAEVERLEEFPTDRVERTASVEAVQYRGRIMPLVRLSRIMGWAEGNTQNSESLRVVVHRQRGQNAGLVVPHIVDIVDCPHTMEKQPREGSAVIGTSVLAGRVTDVIHLAEAFRIAGVASAGEPVS